MTGVLRVRALLRAAQAFWSTLVLAQRPSESAVPAVVAAPAKIPIPMPVAPRAPLSAGLRSAGVENRCPVCQARFRGMRTCSRCGADLEPVMLLTVMAWQLRQAARQALDAGDAGRALEFATEAQAIQQTESGAALRLLSAWLKAEAASSSPAR